MKIVNVPIFYNPENSASIEAIHGSVPLQRCELKNVVFTAIPVALCSDTIDGLDVTRLYFGDTGFISNLQIEKLVTIFSEL